MKKLYETPYLVEESFQLNAAVAGSCSKAINHYANACGKGTGTDGKVWQYFNETNCTVNLEASDGGDDDDEFCYHGPYYGTFTYS